MGRRKGVKIPKGYRAYKFGDRIQFQEKESSTVGYGKGKFPPRSFVTGHLTSSVIKATLGRNNKKRRRY